MTLSEFGHAGIVLKATVSECNHRARIDGRPPLRRPLLVHRRFLAQLHQGRKMDGVFEGLVLEPKDLEVDQAGRARSSSFLSSRRASIILSIPVPTGRKASS